ncbi:MAG TPA: hypothetical protein VHH36_06440, partial [Candidatus Thermoplasmatota archaeon]|nr:hypothetical protein [Candidatus Thermoplasmatota archaeon]
MSRMRRAALLALLVLAPLPAAGGTGDDPTAAALAFLASRQQADGTFQGAPATNVVEAAAQAGADPRAWPSPDRPAWDALAPYGRDDVERYNSRLRLAHAVSVAGYDARDVKGEDHVAAVWAGYDGVQFGSPATVNDDAWAILALHAAGEDMGDARDRALAQLETGRALDGGWSFSRASTRGTADVTGMVLVAKRVAAGAPVEDARARAALDASRDPATGGHDDGFGRANCQSTVWAVHGYAAMGLAPPADAMAYLASLRNADGGYASAPGRASDAWCTAEVVVLLSGAGYPYPRYHPGRLDLPAARAGEPATLRVGAPFTRASWRVGDAALEGAT